MKHLLLLLSLWGALAGLPACGQPYAYIYTKATTLSAATEVITIQLPPGATTPDRRVTFKGVAVYCSVQCSFTLERDGAAATTTSATPAPINASVPPAYAQAYNSSNVGSGTVLADYTMPQGGILILDITQKTLALPASNVTVRFGSMTGTVKTNWQWEER